MTTTKSKRAKCPGCGKSRVLCVYVNDAKLGKHDLCMACGGALLFGGVASKRLKAS